MSLRVGLTLSVSSINFRSIIPKPLDGDFKILLTQQDDAIITQNEMYILINEVKIISP